MKPTNLPLFLVVLVLLAGNVWAWFAGPCELYSWAPAGRTPARCLMR